MMPFITSQFLTREKGDRPELVPTGRTNLAFTGQFCELAGDVVFTVAYLRSVCDGRSVRASRIKAGAPSRLQGSVQSTYVISRIRDIARYENLKARQGYFQWASEFRSVSRVEKTP